MEKDLLSKYSGAIVSIITNQAVHKGPDFVARMVDTDSSFVVLGPYCEVPVNESGQARNKVAQNIADYLYNTSDFH